MMIRKNRLSLLLAVGALLLLAGPGCTERDADPAAGTVDGACLEDGSCNSGLKCVEEKCQDVPVPDTVKDTCKPVCDGKACGPDGCGGVCGDCGGLESCTDGQCVCKPSCSGKVCGDDGCGGICGECGGGNNQCMGGNCICVPDCDGMECGDDGCGGFCGECIGWLAECIEGECICEPDCIGADCGDDGCGGVCGECGEGEECVDWECWSPCEPDCDGKECGDDGCDGTCGECAGDLAECVEGACECTPDCVDAECGDDGCLGSCGDCPVEFPFCIDWICEDTCDPQCDGLECGDDGCGDVCGVCEEGAECLEGLCDFGPCGPCPPDTTCNFAPELWEDICGADGCQEGLDDVGMCGDDDGQTVYWCDMDITFAIDCNVGNPDGTCEFFEEGGYYDCSYPD